MHAYCYASGQIGFGRSVPDGALPIANGPARKLRSFIEPVARHSRTSDTLLVPGVPEAEDQDAALDALLAWTKWIAKGAPARVSIIHSQHKPQKRPPQSPLRAA